MTAPRTVARHALVSVIALVMVAAPLTAQAARRGHVLVANQQSANASLIDLATDSMRFIDVGTGRTKR